MASVRKREWTHNGETKAAWVVAYTDGAGKRRLKTFDLQRDANKYRTRVETEIEKGSHIPDSTAVTVADVIGTWLRWCEARVAADELSPETLNSYRGMSKNHVLPYLGATRVSRLTIPIIQAWVDKIVLGGASPEVVRYAVLCVRLSFAEACRAGTLTFSVLEAAKLRLPRLRKAQILIPSKEQVSQIFDASDGLFRAVVCTAVFTGMRQGELRGLTWSHVDLKNGVVKVEQQAEARARVAGEGCRIRRTKTAASVREIPIAPGLKRMLEQWQPLCPASDLGLVFPSERGHPIHVTTFRNDRWIPLLQKAGLTTSAGDPLFHFHSLRHVTASLFIEQGVPPKELQRLMGHTSIKLTFDRYGHLYEQHERTRAALHVIEGAFGFSEERAPTITAVRAVRSRRDKDATRLLAAE